MKVNTFQVFTVLFVCAGLFQSCDETQRASVFRSAATPITVLQPTSIDVPQSYVADVQAIQFVEVKPKVEGFVQHIQPQPHRQGRGGIGNTEGRQKGMTKFCGSISIEGD